MKFPKERLDDLDKRASNNSLRSLKQLEGIDFSSNDYLGLSKSKSFIQEIEAEWQTFQSKSIGSTGSRLLSGNESYAVNLETNLAHFFHGEAALLFNNGYTANTGLLSCIANREDTIVYDKYCHASIRDGIKLSDAKSFGFTHNSFENLSKKLANATGNKFVVIESVYSMDGDIAPLKEIESICKTYNAYLIVDEAHSTGIYGKHGEGLCVQEEVNTFARIHTFGKAMGMHGSCIVGSTNLIEYLINFSRPFIYTTAMPLHSLICIANGIKKLPVAMEERAQLQKNIELYNSIMGSEGMSPIKTVVVPGNKEVKAFADKLQKLGFLIFPILSPTVQEGRERIRICLHSFNTKEEIIALTNNLKTTQ